MSPKSETLTFECLIPRRPLSLQAKGGRLHQWKAFVQAEAAKVWTTPAHQSGDLQLTLVYLSGAAPPDIDNVIKPIQDALRGLVYSDDALISDVDSHRRPLLGTFDLTRLPPLLLRGVSNQQECVYVRVAPSRSLEEYL